MMPPDGTAPQDQQWLPHLGYLEGRPIEVGGDKPISLDDPDAGLRGGLRPGRSVLDASRRGPDHGTAPPPLPDRGRRGPVRGGPEPCYGGVPNAGRRRGRHRAAGAETPEAPGAGEGSRLRRSGVRPAGRLGGEHVRGGGGATPVPEGIRDARARRRRSRSAPARVSTRRRTRSGFVIWREAHASSEILSSRPSTGTAFSRSRTRHGWSLTAADGKPNGETTLIGSGHAELRGPGRFVVGSRRVTRYGPGRHLRGYITGVYRMAGTATRENRGRPTARRQRRGASGYRARDVAG